MKMKLMNWLSTTLALLLVVVISVEVNAQPTVDGTVDAAYGSALSVQTVQTEFGDNFSELNAAYATIDGGNLYLILTGNLENNFNKLNIFIDSVAGGQNAIDSTNNPTNYDSMVGEGFGNGWAPYDNRGLGDSPAPLSQAQEGQFTFDAGFEADYAMLFRRGAGKFDLDFAMMNQTAIAADEASDVFGGTEEGANNALALTGGTFEIAFDNSNVAGIAGGTLAADPVAAAAVTTGIELAIPLAAIGNPTGDIKVSAFINGSNHDYVSNQFLGGLQAPQGNLGSDGSGNFLSADGNENGEFDAGDDFDGDTADGPGGLGADALGVGLIDLNNFAGDQFFTITQSSSDPADLNNDGFVDGLDLGILLGNWGTSTTPDMGELDGTPPVDGLDLGILLGAWNPPPAAATAAVPEPGSLVLLSLAAVLAGYRRKRS